MPASTTDKPTPDAISTNASERATAILHTTTLQQSYNDNSYSGDDYDDNDNRYGSGDCDYSCDDDGDYDNDYTYYTYNSDDGGWDYSGLPLQ